MVFKRSLQQQSQPTSFHRWLILFAFFNALIAAGMSFTLCNWPDAFLPGLYLGIAMLINFVMWSSLLALPLALLPLIKIPLMVCRLVSFVIYSMALTVVLVNLKVYALYHFHLNGMVLNLVFSGALLENLAFSVSMWLSTLGAVAIVVLSVIVTYKLSLMTSNALHMHSGFMVTSIVVIIIALQLFTGTADALGWKNYTAQHRYIPWMQVTTMRSTLKKMGFAVVDKKDTRLNKDQGNQIQYPLEPLNCSTKENYNILFLIVDSLRADMLTPDVMPFTHSLQDQSLNYRNHYSNANATRYGMFSLFYGLPGNYWKAMLEAERGSLLFDETIARNYQHFIYGSSTLTFPEFDRTIFTRLREQLQKGSYNHSATNDININQRLIEDIRQTSPDKPFFGMAFYDAPHAYSLPKDFNSPFKPLLEEVNYMELHENYDPTPFLNLYKSTALFVDGLIRDVFQQLEQQQLLDKTIVIITSDHGQEFNDTGNNTWGHNSNFSQWQTKVPMLMRWPGKETKTISNLTSHEDILPTLLNNAFGCTTPTDRYSTGMNLFTSIPETRSVLFESWTDRAILYDNKMFLISPYGDIDTVDLNNRTMDDVTVPMHIITENLERMSRFVKSTD